MPFKQNSATTALQVNQKLLCPQLTVFAVCSAPTRTLSFTD